MAAGEERGDNLEGGVFRGGANEGDSAILNKGENRILLSLVEAVNLIYKQDSLLLV